MKCTGADIKGVPGRVLMCQSLINVSVDVKRHERTRTLTGEPVWPSGKALG